MKDCNKKLDGDSKVFLVFIPSPIRVGYDFRPHNITNLRRGDTRNPVTIIIPASNIIPDLDIIAI
jgi:hypothetical protein